MFTIDVSSGSAHAGVAAQPQVGEKMTPPQVSKTPPTQAVEPSQAVVPVQEPPQAKSLRGRADEVRAAVEKLNAVADSARSASRTKVRFSMDDESEKLVVKVIDRETDEVVRQIPAKAVLDRIKALQDLKGLLFDSQS